MARLFRGHSVRWLLVALLTVALAVPVAVIASASSDARSPSPAGPAGAVAAAARTGHIGAAKRVHPQLSAKPFVPTKAQLSARARAMAGLAKHKAPSLGRHTSSADVKTNGGPETNSTGRQLPNDFKIFRSSLINSTCSGCGQSSINEPSAANNGKFVVETSNWNIAYTLKGAATNIP